MEKPKALEPRRKIVGKRVLPSKTEPSNECRTDGIKENRSK